MKEMPQILPIRQQAEVVRGVLRRRLETILPAAMRKANLDLWIILCQEDDYDPIFKTMVPLDTWAPILQILVFYDRGESQGIERINLSMTATGDLYDRPWQGTDPTEQWQMLGEIVATRSPSRIGINTGSIQWAAGGLTQNLYQQLIKALPSGYAERLVSAETACTHWLMTLSEAELVQYTHACKIGHWLIEHCFSPQSITPGVTTTEDLEWLYWQRSLDMGLELAFKPFFRLIRRESVKPYYPEGDKTIRPGDLIHCDVGIKYLRLNTDNQELAYIRQDGETAPPDGFLHLLAQGNRLQEIFLVEFKHGLSGDQLLANILQRARKAGIPNPRVYSHSLGLLLHEPGPLIGLPWEQDKNPGRGDVALDYDTCFTMELSVEGVVPEWDQQSVRLSLEQDVKFTRRGCEPIDGVQTRFHLI